MLSTSSELVVRLDTPLPASLPVGKGTAVFCNGACFHPHKEVHAVHLAVGGARITPSVWPAPRLDLVLALEEPRAYRSGFWATVPLPAQSAPGRLGLELTAELEDGERVTTELGTIDIEPQRPATATSNATIAIAMATHNPDPQLLARQLDSLRAQTETDWICLIRDDGSSLRAFAELSAMVAGDQRFLVSRGERPLGPYRNFERLLSHLPAGPSLVALCDQDDRWEPDKLSVLRERLGRGQLVYCDQRIVDRDGHVRRGTMWQGRRNQHRNLASLLIANSVTGAASLMRREVVELALPFPELPGLALHDHWLALVALATGRIGYVNRPLGDYVQHVDAVLGRVAADRGAAVPRPDARAAYFYGYLPREVLAHALLARCAGSLTAAKRRSLERMIASGRSPGPFAWLLARGLLHRRETLGTELELARGILWQALIPLRTRRQGPPRPGAFDASCPEPTAETLGSSRLARWRATL